jgi:hypothetical protein
VHVIAQHSCCGNQLLSKDKPFARTTGDTGNEICETGVILVPESFKRRQRVIRLLLIITAE